MEQSPRRVELPRSQVSVKTVITVTSTAAALGLAVWVVLQAKVAVTLIAFSAVIAVALEHGVARLQRLRVGRRLAVGVVMAGLLGAGVGLALLLIPPAVAQIRTLITQTPELLGEVRSSQLYAWLNERFELDASLNRFLAEAPRHLQEGLDAAITAITSLLALFGALATIFFLTLFMLAFGGPLVRRFLDEAVPERRWRYERVLRKTYDSVGGYIGGLAIVCLTNAALTTTFLAILRIPFFLPLGLVTGLSSIIPLVGSTLAGALLSLVMLAVKGPWYAVGTALYVVLYQQFENHVLGPVVYRRTVDINPLIQIVSFLVLTEVMGFAGALVAVPMVAVLQIVVREVLLLRREQLNLPPEGPVSVALPPGRPQPGAEPADERPH